MSTQSEVLSAELGENLHINDEKESSAENTPGVSYPLKVLYCGECNMPLEYCSFSGQFDKCKAWRENRCEQLDDNDARTAQDDDAVAEKKHQTRGGKKPGKAAKEVKASQITLQRAPRGKNKSVTVVKGLSTHGVDLKQAAKFFAGKFACGSSVSAPDEIVIQGDVKDELFDIIPEKWKIEESVLVDLGDQKR